MKMAFLICCIVMVSACSLLAYTQYESVRIEKQRSVISAMEEYPPLRVCYVVLMNAGYSHRESVDYLYSAEGIPACMSKLKDKQ